MFVLTHLLVSSQAVSLSLQSFVNKFPWLSDIAQKATDSRDKYVTAFLRIFFCRLLTSASASSMIICQINFLEQ